MTLIILPETEREAQNPKNTSNIVASGVIGPETPALFKALVNSRHIKRATVFLSSTGGDLWAAMALGREIRRYGFNTEVGYARRTQVIFVNASRCLSSCAYAFLGGNVRDIAGTSGDEMLFSIVRPKSYLHPSPDRPQEYLGFHQFRLGLAATSSAEAGGALEELRASTAQSIASALSAYIAEMGVEPLVLDFADKAPSIDEPGEKNMYFPTMHELTASAILQVGRFGPLELVAEPEGLALISRFSNPHHWEKQISIFCVQDTAGRKALRVTSTTGGRRGEGAGDILPVGTLLLGNSPKVREMSTSVVRWFFAVTDAVDQFAITKSGTGGPKEALFEDIKLSPDILYDNYATMLDLAAVERMKKTEIVTIVRLKFGQGFEHDIVMDARLLASLGLVMQHCFALPRGMQNTATGWQPSADNR
ncbi:hypothetical protein P6144_15420 [Sphingomonas sp. HITSZ_GF]|uniref:COG3904 family protein n=1 Tax=Sphingomonas sp. HITSZ_GF TaxID=3037247 RepID=UPI00240D21B9|nr:hypothetical protein [Sphingomonas sp. HITSZ_GF]MDG2535049.1 hypothetical protein [Sphingomonas sp. HITSZ_GF]